MSVYLYLALHDPMDCSSPGSSVYGIFQARILEWAAISYSRGSSQPRDQTCISCISCISTLAVRFFTTVPPGKPADTTPTHTHTHTHSRWSPLEMFTAKLSTREWDRKQLWFLLKYIIGYTVLFDQRNKSKNNNKNNFESPPLLTLFYIIRIIRITRIQYCHI